jgi:L-cysteine desulfidase
MVRIAAHHTNIVHMEKNGEVLLDEPVIDTANVSDDPSILNVKDIVEFADTVELNRVDLY